MKMLDIKKIDWDKGDGLIPAIVQDHSSGQVLMLGYMNSASLQQTLDTQKVTFYSRTKQALWVKGETSGNFLELVDLMLDCDHDTILVMAKPIGPTCHQGTASCFVNDGYKWEPLQQLESIIMKRSQDSEEDSYTVSLLKSGINKISQKVGEEATETIIASLKESDERLCSETADLFYHILVLLRARELSINNVFDVLEKRMNIKV